MKNYDVIIIGAGIGGLTCGALLAKNGLKTLVLEQYHNVGGLCSTFKKNGFSFNLASIFLLEKNLISKNLEELGIETGVEFVEIDPIYEYVFSDFKIKIPKSIEKFIEKLIKLAPEEEKNIQRFFYEITDIYNIIENLRFAIYFKGNMPVSHINHSKLMEYGTLYGKMRWDEFLDRYFINKKLKAILSMESIFLGLPPSKISVFAMVAIIMQEHKYGIVQPKKGMSGLADAYADALKKFGGELHLNSKVNKIIIDKNICRGVELSNGEKILSNITVSNTDIRETYFNLIGEKFLDPNFVKKIKQLEMPLSAFKLCIGTDQKLNIGPDISPIIFKSSDYDLEAIYKNVSRCGLSDDNYYLLFISSLLDPSMGQNGGNCIEILTCIPYQLNGKTWSTMNQMDYDQLKQVYVEKLVKDATKIFPNLKEHIIFQDAVTPNSLERITSRFKGVPYVHADILNEVAKNKTPFKNLYYVGSSSFPGDGINNTILSGIITSNLIIIDMGKRD